MTRFDYWLEAVTCALDEVDVYLPMDKLTSVVADLIVAAENQSQAFGEHCIPHPATIELADIKRKYIDNMEDMKVSDLALRREIARRAGCELHDIEIRYGSVVIN